MDERLKQHIDAIETLEAEKAGIGEDIKDRYTVAKSDGYDPKALRAIIRRRKMDREEREQLDGIIEIYEAALAD